MVADAVGKVEALHPESKSSRSLKKKDTISEEQTVKVNVASSASLVFSNGSNISLRENSTLVIAEFLQNPFSTPFAMPIATEEPTISSTSLNLANGEIVCNVKKLRTDGGSSLTINTPVGAAGVRGTIFAISYLPNLNGTDQGSFTLSVTEGEVSLTDSDGNVTLVAAGQEIVISFTTAVDPLTGATIVTEILSTQVRDIPPDRRDMIARVVAKGEKDAETIIFDATEVDVLDRLQIPDGLPEVVDPNPVTEVNPQSNGVTD